MALSSTDFKHGDTEFGIFYPTGYVLAAFPDAAQADRAVAALLAAGFARSDLVVATGAVRALTPAVLRKFDALTFTDLSSGAP